MIEKEESLYPGRISVSRYFRFINGIYKVVGLESLIWIAAIIFLSIIEPMESSHFTICPLSAIGIEFCPGCGLGKSASYILHGDLYNSINTHPLGIFALIVLTIRIISLVKINWSNYGKRFSVNARA